MLLDKFCFECGGKLQKVDGRVECSECGAVYSELLISETLEENEEFKVTELSVSMDITIKTMKQPFAEVAEPVAVKPEYELAGIEEVAV